MKSFFVYVSAAVLALFLSANADAISFHLASSPAVGDTPMADAAGDFNRDGNLDLVVANYYGDIAGDYTVSVLLGNGDGTFDPAVNYLVGNNPVSVVVADFDNDGNPDLVVADSGSDDIAVLFGNGDGTFDPAVYYPVGVSPESVVVDKFDSGTIFDLAVANWLDDNVSILLGVSGGTFNSAVNYNVGLGPMSVAAGKFNNDAIVDLAVANVDDGNVSILLGNGNGTFTPAAPPTVAAGLGPISVAVGRFNSDATDDLVVANNDDDNVSILLGNGNGTFASAVNYSVGASSSTPESIAVADFDGDGNIDLAVVNSSSDDVSVLLGNGDGTFQPAVSFPVGSDPKSVVAGDFNGDGRLDLAVANSYDNNVSILLNSIANLSVIMTALPSTALAGQNVTYTITITNYGPDTATGVELTDTLPADTTFVSAGSTQGSCLEAGGVVTCTVGEMANGATVTVTIVATAPDIPGTITNSATVTGNAIDPVPANGTDSQETTVEYPIRRFLAAPIVYYTTINAAYTFLQVDEKIQARIGMYAALDLNRDDNIAVDLKGGYGPGFSEPGPSDYSIIRNSLTVSKGTLTVQGIIIN